LLPCALGLVVAVVVACAAAPSKAALPADDSVVAVSEGAHRRAVAPAAPSPSADTTRTATGVTRADSTVRADRLARLRAHDRAGRAPVRLFDQPRWVMARSLVVPGWGQAHNRSWLKAGAVAVGEVWVGTRLLDDLRELDRLDADLVRAHAERDFARENGLIEAYNARLESAVRRQWLLAGVVTYALLDAFVDAHFMDFHIEFESDPALPGGVQPAGQRVSLRWSW
jgi:hypothetical protein